MEIDLTDENPNPAEQMLDQVKKSVDEAISRTESAMAKMGYDVSAASKVADDYRTRVFEYMRINMNAALDYANNLASVKWPADFMGLSAGKALEHGLSAPAMTEMSTAAQAAEEYRTRMFQFMKANLNAMLEYAEQLATVKSPAEAAAQADLVAVLTPDMVQKKLYHDVLAPNMKQGACSLIVAYNNSPDTNYGGVQIDDGRCEWKLLLAPDVKTGTAKLKVSLSGDLGTATLDDEFRVSKGDTIHQGDVNIGLDLEEAPKEVKVGQEFKVTLNTDAKNRSSCEAVVAWPGGLPGTRGETKNPDGNGKCTWRFTVPTAVTKKGEASLQVIVRNKNNSARIATRKFEVRPS